MLLSAWRREVPRQILACPICRFQSDNKNALLDHTAEHIHPFSLRSLPWAPGEGLEEKDDEANEGYFQIHPDFEADSCQSECSSRLPWVLSPAATDSEIIVGSDLKKGPNTMCGQQRLTEDLVEQIPEHILRQEDMGEWIATLPSSTDETETPNIPTTASNTPDNPNHHIHQQTLSKKKSGPSSPTQTIQEYIDPLTTSEEMVHDETIGRIWGYLLPIYEGMDH